MYLIFYDSSLLNEGKASTQCLAHKLTKELVDNIKASTKQLHKLTFKGFYHTPYAFKAK